MDFEADCWVHTEEFRLPDDEQALDPRDPRVVALGGLLATSQRGTLELTECGWIASVEVDASEVVHQLSEASNRGRLSIGKALRQSRMPSAALVRSETHHKQSFPRDASEVVLLDSSGVCALLGVSRQRLHQLRQASWFPLPAVLAGTRPLWNKRDIADLEATWVRRPGRRSSRYGSVR